MNGFSVISNGAALALGLVLVSAGIAKLRTPRATERIIERHAPRLAGLLPVPLGILELVVGFALIVPVLRAPAALAAALVLLLYTSAIAFALARGAAGEDCGCGGLAGQVPIGTGLLARNAVLVVLAVALAWLPVHAPAETCEWLAALAVAVFGLLLWLAVNFLLARETLLADD